MEAVIELITKDNQSHKVKIEIPLNEIALDNLVQPFRELFNKIISLEVRGKKISCKKGCSACCCQLIPLSIPEVFSLYHLIESLPAGHKKRIKKRFARNKNQLHKAGLLNDMKDPRAVLSLDQKYFELGLLCPFLESDCCSIYESRPFVCAEYFVTSPAALCGSPYTSNIKKIKTNLNIGALITAFSARILNLARTPVPLIIVTDWAQRFMQLRYKRYSAKWMFDKLLTALSEVELKEGNIKKIGITLPDLQLDPGGVEDYLG